MNGDCMGTCALCGQTDLDPDEYCYGCGNFVCTDCDDRCPLGPHELADHKADSEEK